MNIQTETTDLPERNRWYHRWALVLSAALIITFFSEYYFMNEGVVISITGFINDPLAILLK